MQKRIEILDSTLRDGAQSRGVSFSLSDKLGAVMLLDNLGVDFIEAGMPFSNPKDEEFFKTAKKMGGAFERVIAFGATRRKGLSCADDTAIAALLAAETERVSIFGKSSALQAERVLCVSEEENISMIADTIKYLTEKGREVFFDAEHYFDGFKENEEYALAVVRAALGAGATRIVLCDTNGGCFPDDIGDIVKKTAAQFDGAVFGIHCHNDTGCAVANTLSAVKNGAAHVQGTLLGIGERCGNANLSTVIPDLQLKLGYDVLDARKLAMLTGTVRHLADITNIVSAPGMPYVGSGAFAHKGGMHVDGVLKQREAFEHIDPLLVGNARSILLGEMSGRGALAARIGEIAPTLTKNSPETLMLLEKLKDLEFRGYQFESATASFELFVMRELGKIKEPFKVVHYKMLGERTGLAGTRTSLATVKIEVDKKSEIRAAEGDGPVNALDIALRSALEVFYPELEKVRLIDYKVRVIEPYEATAAKVRVVIETTDGLTTWTTMGLSVDIIDASFMALCDAIVYYLTMK